MTDTPPRIRVVRGDPPAAGEAIEHEFTRLSQQHAASLFALAMRLTRRVADAEDLLQDTMLAAYQHFEGVRDSASYRPWLFKILSNAWKTRRRRFFRREFNDVTLEEALLEIERTDPVRNVEIRVVESIDHAAVLKALDTLPAEMRQVLWLSDVEGFSLREISEIVDCALGTSASRLARARARLRLKLKQSAGTGQDSGRSQR